MSVLLVWKSRVFVRYFYCICIYGHQVIITVDVSEIPAFPDKPRNVQLFPGKPAKLIISSDIKSQINEDNWQAVDLVQLVSNRQQLIWLQLSFGPKYDQIMGGSKPSYLPPTSQFPWSTTIATIIELNIILAPPPRTCSRSRTTISLTDLYTVQSGRWAVS